jgi:thiol-disulfide isomerase/thioredoxin
MRFLCFIFLLLGPIVAQNPTTGVRGKLVANDPCSARAILEDYRDASGETPEYVEGYSWLARYQLTRRDYPEAQRLARETRALIGKLSPAHPVDKTPGLLNALGAAIEVEAQAAAAQGRKPDAIRLLETEAKQWAGTRLELRIRKNLDLLTLTGRPAPAIEQVDFTAGPTLLYFWAHWCGDCTAQAPAIARIRTEFEKRGLRVVAPTMLYGTAADGKDASPDQERTHIEAAWQKNYAALAGAPHPVSREAMAAYGASSTPTLVFVDRKGLVRLYSPYRWNYRDLAAKVEALLR